MRVAERTSYSLAGAPAAPERDPDGDLVRWRDALTGVLGRTFVGGNSVTALRNGAEIFPAMLRAIGDAERTLEFETYLYGGDAVAERFTRALSAAAQRGVRTKVLLDGVGSSPAARDQAEAMERAGVEVRWFRPPRRWRVWTGLRVDNRTHRKICVVDGQLAFTGGVAISGEWDGDARGPEEWRDTQFALAGPAASDLRAAFYAHWLESGDWDGDSLRPVPPHPEGRAEVMVVPSVGLDVWSTAATVFHTLPKHARRYLRIVTPYFVPNDETMTALEDCARRGVRVELLVPGPYIDHRLCQLAGDAYLTRLRDAGVKIWRYQRTFIHTKCVTADGVLSVIGSANFNRRSLMKDDEILALVLDPTVTRMLDQHFDEDLDRSKLVCEGDAEKRGWLRRGAEAVAALFRQEL